jgi:hypothetical protein
MQTDDLATSNDSVDIPVLPVQMSMLDPYSMTVDEDCQQIITSLQRISCKLKAPEFT